jgi:hypothetical protein
MNKIFFPLAAEGRRLLAIEGWAAVLSALLYFLSPQLLPAAAALLLAAMAFTLFFFRRNLIEIDHAGGKTLGVEQIAGSIARRIACGVKAGEDIVPGSRLGLIYFGSQVAVYLPPGAEILVQPSLPVKPCRTVLARL